MKLVGYKIMDTISNMTATNCLDSFKIPKFSKYQQICQLIRDIYIPQGKVLAFNLEIEKGNKKIIISIWTKTL